MKIEPNDLDLPMESNNDLSTEKNSMTDKKSYACTHCDATFTRSDHVKRHERIHNGEKPFACIICDEKFTQLANLKEHEKVHTEEKPFTCKSCDRKFLVRQMSLEMVVDI